MVADIEKLKALSEKSKVCVEVADHCIMNVEQSTSTVSIITGEKRKHSEDECR